MSGPGHSGWRSYSAKAGDESDGEQEEIEFRSWHSGATLEAPSRHCQMKNPRQGGRVTLPRGKIRVYARAYMRNLPQVVNRSPKAARRCCCRCGMRVLWQGRLDT